MPSEHCNFQAFNLWEREQLRQRLQWPGQHGEQHDPQPRPAGEHTHHHAAAGPDTLRPAAAPAALADQEDKAGPVSAAEDVWAGLREGNS